MCSLNGSYLSSSLRCTEDSKYNRNNWHVAHCQMIASILGHLPSLATPNLLQKKKKKKERWHLKWTLRMHKNGWIEYALLDIEIILENSLSTKSFILGSKQRKWFIWLSIWYKNNNTRILELEGIHNSIVESNTNFTKDGSKLRAQVTKKIRRK